MRHIDTSYLWLQEASSVKAVKFGKVPGAENPADIGTKHLSKELLNKHVIKMGLEFKGGRAEGAQELNYLEDEVVLGRCKRFNSMLKFAKE